MATTKDATPHINSVWSHLLALEDAARRCANRSTSELVTERTAELASAALAYAAAQLNEMQPDNDAARRLLTWSRDVIAGTRDDRLDRYQRMALSYSTRFVSRKVGTWDCGAGTFHPLKERSAKALADELRHIGVDASVVPHATDHDLAFVLIAARSLPSWGS